MQRKPLRQIFSQNLRISLLLLCLLPDFGHAICNPDRGTGDLGIVIERATGSLLIVNHSQTEILCRVENLGDLSHASAVFSRDARYAYVFGRDGGLSKIDILTGKTVNRIVQSGNAIGGAISQDGKLIAVSNYAPGGVNIFDAETLALLHSIPATLSSADKTSKTVGLVDAPGNRFIYSLFEGNSTWLLDLSKRDAPKIKRFENIGLQPYDGLITSEGRYYIAGLFGQEGLALLDTWHPEKGMHRILSGYGKHEKKLPVYKMPHMEGCTTANGYLFLPAAGHHELLVVAQNTWHEKKHIKVFGQPVFAIARPDGRQIWVNFALPDNHIIQIIDTETLSVIHQLVAGKGVMHMEFTPKGEQIWVSVRDKNEIQIYSSADFTLLKTLQAENPSGIFFTHRAHRIGL